MTDKPPYRIPSMREIAAIPLNGFKVISLFAGAGGSSLGYRLSGFKILWASEFVPAAREVYELNADEGTIVDGNDIRIIDPKQVMRDLRIKPGDLDVLDGSPPCASFSMAGNREKDWSKVKKYSSTEQRTDDLFFEYVRFLNALQPKVFVAENVAGLVRGTAKGHFLEILRAMTACGYVVEARLLDAQWLGVPQARERLIFIGARDDLKSAPVFPAPLLYRYGVRDAVPAIKLQGDNGPFGKGMMRTATVPSPTIGAGPSSGNGRASPAAIETFAGERRKLTIDELKLICSFPADFELTGSYNEQWERLGRAVPPAMMMRIAAGIREMLQIKAAKPRPRAPARARRLAKPSTPAHSLRGPERSP